MSDTGRSRRSLSLTFKWDKNESRWQNFLLVQIRMILLQLSRTAFIHTCSHVGVFKEPKNQESS